MTGFKHTVVLAVGLAVASAGMAAAGQQRPYRVSDQQLKDLVNRIDTHEHTFRNSFERAIDRSPIKGSPTADLAERSMKDFKDAADLLRDRVNGRQSGASDAENLLRRASAIDGQMTRFQFETAVQRDWQAVRLDMNDLTRAYGIAWNWSAALQTMPARVDDNQVKQLLKTIGQKADRFDKGLERAFTNSQYDAGRGKDEIRQSVKDLKQATDRLRDRVNGRQANTLDAEEVLRRGASIDGFMQRYQLSAQSEQNWLVLRGDLDKLAGAYNVGWGWSDSGYPSAEAYRHPITGTYQLEASRSDDPRRTAEQASRGASSDQRQRTYQRLLGRLESPQMIAIERRGSSVTMSSTHGQPVSFEVDGRDRAETWSGGRTINTRVTFEGERLRVATSGDRRSDYLATFEPADSGRSLLVTRTIYDESLRQPVTARSAYRRTSDQPRWNLENGNGGGYDDTRSPGGALAVPDGTRFVARLDNDLRSTAAREGDRWTMTAVSPSQYEGAIVQGYVSSVNAPGRPAGSTDMTLYLESIRLRNGDSSPFAGVIDSIRTPDGDAIMVDRGTIGDGDGRNGSRTSQAVERGAIGAVLGGLIGAIAGGGKGALIGAGVGAGVGAGTVLVQGRDQFELRRGTEMTFTSSDPRYRW